MATLFRLQLVVLAIALAACAPDARSEACLTQADCADDEQCIAGGCVSVERDAGARADSGRDAGPMDAGEADDAATDLDAAEPIDAFVPTDSGPLPGESCANPIPLALDSMGRAHAEGSFSGYGPDHRIGCGAGDSPDVIFVVEIGDARQDIEITTSGDAATDTIVSFSESCSGSGEFFSCHDDREPEDPSTRMVLRRYGARQLFVMVRGEGATEVGSFVLDVTVRPVANTSSCATPIDLTGGAFVVGWHTATDAAPHPSCLPPGPMVSDVYRIRRDGEMNIDYLGAYFGGLEGAIALVDSCTAPVTESFCALSTLTTGGYYGLDRSTLPLAATELGYLVVAAPDASSSYSVHVFP